MVFIRKRLIITKCLVCLSAFGWLAGVSAAGYKTVTAQSGDGIYRLLQRYGLSSDSLAAFIRLNRENLGPGNTLYQGREYKLPATEDFINEPLFGSKLARVKVLDEQLGGAVFYLVSGHGGPDPGGMGKVGSHTLCEDEYAYDVTLRLGRCLMEHGAKVYFIIRDPHSGIQESRYLRSNKDEVCYPNQKIPLNQVARLRQRATAVNGLYKQDPAATYKRCIVIHVDARQQHEKIDIFFYHHRSSNAGKQLAITMRNTVEQKYRLNQPDRGYTGTVGTRSLYMINATAPPTVFIELGNIHHERDQKRLTEPNNRQALANWLAEAVLRDHRQSVR